MRAFSIALIAILLILPFNTFCYEVPVHRKIADSAMNASEMKNYLANRLGIKFESDTFEGKLAQIWISDGSDWEDNIIGLSANFRYMNHFYDPRTGLGLNVGGMNVGDSASSLVWGKDHANNLFNWHRTRQHFIGRSRIGCNKFCFTAYIRAIA